MIGHIRHQISKCAFSQEKLKKIWLKLAHRLSKGLNTEIRYAQGQTLVTNGTRLRRLIDYSPAGYCNSTLRVVQILHIHSNSNR